MSDNIMKRTLDDFSDADEDAMVQMADEIERQCKKQKKEHVWQCNRCSTIFSRKDCWKRHMQSVHNEQDCLQCDVCNEKFSRADALQRHMRQVHGWEKKRFQCDECDKSFDTMQKLVKHQLAHSRLITCPVCDARFNHKTNLTRHMRRVHKKTAEKPSGETYCTLCQKVISCTSNYKRHMEKVHGQKMTHRTNTFKCRHCHEEFSEYAALFHHIANAHPLDQSGGRVSERSTSPIVPLQDDPPLHKDEMDEHALERDVQNRIIHPRGNERYDLLLFFTNVRSRIQSFLHSKIRQNGGIKWNLCVQVEMSRDSVEGEEITASPYFRSNTNVALEANLFDEHDLNEALHKMHASMENFLREGSGWNVKTVLKLDIHTVIYKPISGSSYIPLPKSFVRGDSVLNITNQDSKCFTWSLLASLHPAGNSPYDAKHYIPFESELNMEGIDYPVTLHSIDKFESQNINISVNVFTYEDKDIMPLKITKKRDALHHVDLLYLKNKNTSHYCLITDFNKFLYRSKSQHDAMFFCPYCLHGFIREDLLKDHKTRCSQHVEQKVQLPEEGEDDWLEFKNYDRMLKVPFCIYADFETINRKIHSCVPNPKFSSTTPTTKLEVCGFAYKVVCIEPKYTKPTVVYRGEDASTKLIECLLKEQEEIDDILKIVKPMELTQVDKQKARIATSCCICKQSLDTSEKPVRHHNHVTGAFIGMAHNACNLNCQQATHTCVIFHNLKFFDGHILCEQVGKFKKQKLECIAQTPERYISFSLGNLRFIDSLQFLPSSLQTLVDNLAQDGIEAFPHFTQEFPSQKEAELLLRKGVYPYEYVDSMSKFSETTLPNQDAFYSSITRESISNKDYEHAQNVFSSFNMKTMGDYHDLYLKTDVVLLADVFEQFRNVCMTQYELDPCHYYTSPGLAWEACLKMTKVSLQLMTDIDQVLFIENGIRGGISQISNRYKRANNPLLESYDPSKPTSYLSYLDMNNLYGYAMIQKLPVDSFQFLNEDEIEQFDLASVSENSDIGYILEVDLEYSSSLHDAHNDYPLAPERKFVDSDSLSPYAQHLWKKLHGKKDDDDMPPRTKVEKLMVTLEDKEKYIVHYRNLQLYLKLGMKVKQIHRVLEFRQREWMKPYIQFNTEQRQKARSTFEKNFYKLMNVSVFGKTMENVRKHKNIELVHTQKRLRKLSAKPTYKTSKIFTEDLIAVEMMKSKVKLYKPSYSGMCILDLSKLAMYEFYYSYLKETYGEKVQLQFTDTDSFLFWCQTEDIYADMAQHLDLFDTSDYPADHFLHSNINKKVLGKMKDETNGRPISEFVGLRSKMYSFRCGDKEEKRAKGIAKVTVKKDLRFTQYKNTLFDETQQLSTMTSIRSHDHRLYTETIHKTGLSAFDDKRYLINAVESYAYGHCKIVQNI